MIYESDVHTAICQFIKDKNTKPCKIIAGYEAAMDMMSFAGSVSYEGGSSIVTPFGLLPIEYSVTYEIKDWSIK